MSYSAEFKGRARVTSLLAAINSAWMRHTGWQSAWELALKCLFEGPWPHICLRKFQGRKGGELQRWRCSSCNLHLHSLAKWELFLSGVCSLTYLSLIHISEPTRH